jgi:hypothetical protein
MFEYNVIIGRNVIIYKAMKGNNHGKEEDIQYNGNHPGRRNGRFTHSLVHPVTPGRTQTLTFVVLCQSLVETVGAQCNEVE